MCLSSQLHKALWSLSSFSQLDLSLKAFSPGHGSNSSCCDRCLCSFDLKTFFISDHVFSSTISRASGHVNGFAIVENHTHRGVDTNTKVSNATLPSPKSCALTGPSRSFVTARLQAWWSRFQSTRCKLRGWRYGIVACTTAAGLILLINFILLALALTLSHRSDGTGLLFSGDCDVAKRRDSTLHLLINVLSTILLCASSYTMQCLSSPTRRDVDRAHRQHKSLDVGLLSLKNLFYIEKKKVILWVLLSLSTVPLHLL